METVNKTLVNSLNSQVGEENSFEKIGKNRKLAKLLGAKLFLSYDWNLFAKPTYSLSEIQKTLNDSGIKDSAQSFVKEDLRLVKTNRRKRILFVLRFIIFLSFCFQNKGI